MTEILKKLISGCMNNPEKTCPRPDDVTCKGCKYDLEEGCDMCGRYADYLLANGVIVPPVKIGQTVYLPCETDGECEPYVDVGTVFAIGIDEGHTMWISVRYESGLRYYHTLDDFDKTIFITREDAEKALAERSGNETDGFYSHNKKA